MSSARGVLAGPRDEADRGRQHDLALGEVDRRADRRAYGVRHLGDPPRFLLGQQHERELVAGKARQRVLRGEEAVQAARDGQQDRVAGRDAEAVIDLLEAVDVDHEDRRPHVLFRLGERHDGVEPVEEKLAIGQAGQIVMHGIVEQAFFALLLLGRVASVPTQRTTSPSEPMTGRARNVNQ
jgi:hypothetical protein